MSDQPRNDGKLRMRALAADASHPFALTPDAAGRAALAAELRIPGIRKLRFNGALEPLGSADWRLEAMLGATVVQDCVVTLAPVVTRIDVPVSRTYLADPPSVPEADEVEMSEDDSVEPLPTFLDLNALMAEALALALPDYPHVEGAAPLEQSYGAPGAEPLADDVVKPFAGLAGLRAKLTKD